MSFRNRAIRVPLLPVAALLTIGAGALAQPRPVPPPRALALVGVTSVGDRTQAWLVDLNTRRRATLSIGETAFGYRLKRAEPERVVLTRGGQDFPLRLGEKPVPPSPAPPPAAAAPPPVVLPPEVVQPPELQPAPAPEEALSPDSTPSEPVEALPSRQRDLRQVPELYPGYPFGPGLSPQEAAALGAYPGYYPGAAQPYYPGLYPPYAEVTLPYPGVMAPYPGVPYPGAPSNYPSWAYPGAQQVYPAWAYPDWSLDPGSALDPVTSRWDSPRLTSPGFAGSVPGYAGSRWNPQRSRRYSGYFGGGAPSNPQTFRRRQRLFR
jgi:hypothetical protein